MTLSGFINVPLIRNPLNWCVVLLMVTLGGFVVDSFIRWQHQTRDPAA